MSCSNKYCFVRLKLNLLFLNLTRPPNFRILSLHGFLLTYFQKKSLEICSGNVHGYVMFLLYQVHNPFWGFLEGEYEHWGRRTEEFMQLCTTYLD